MNNSPLIRRARPWLGTIVEIAVNENAADTIEAGFAAIAHVHGRMSFHEATSDIAALNRAYPGDMITVDIATTKVLRAALALCEASNGLFDVTIGRILVQYMFLPHGNIGHLGRYCGTVRDIDIVDDHHICLNRRLLIDLGGIAKGYAVDMAVAALQAAGAQQGIVNAGGDLRIFGDQEMPVQIRLSDGQLSKSLFLKNTSIASSENIHTRRRFRGKTVTPHIGLDRKAVLTDQTVSVIASSCMIADAMTKVAMIDPELANTILYGCSGYVVDLYTKAAA